MEKEKEILAKIMTKEREFVISDKVVVIGRTQSFKFSTEVEGILTKLI
jgi:hypothetical protein